MASVIHDKSGLKRIQFVNGGRSRTLRIGRMDNKNAETLRLRIGRLLEAKLTGALDGETARWLAALDDSFHDRLQALGVVGPRARKQSVTLADLWARFKDTKVIKPATAAIYARVQKSMEEHFGADLGLDSIGPEQAEGWCKALADDGLARATRSKLIQVARQLFGRAEMWGLIPTSPFRGIKPGTQVNPARQAYIPLSDLEKILEACGSHEWKCIFALARLSGVRCPSEIAGLRWGDVDFGSGLMTVTSPKCEHHGEAGMRVVPIVPRLHEVLMDAFTAAAAGAVYVVPKLRYADTNLRTQAHRILARAGLQPPPKLFVNLRASRATDWAQEHGGHVAAKWLGHSPLIALKHYAQVRPEDFERATGRRMGDANLTQSGADKSVPGEDNDHAQPRNRPQKPLLSAAVSSGPEREWAILAPNSLGRSRRIREFRM
jgi:integrase